MKEIKIEVRDKVDLFLRRGPYYPTVINDITKDGLLFVSVPIYRGISIVLHMDQELQLFFYRDSGRYAVDVKVIGFELSGEIKLIKLLPLSLPVKQQRRESFRLKARLRAIIRPQLLGAFPFNPSFEDDEEMDYVFTSDISSTGIAFRTTVKYSVGEKFFLKLFLEWPEPDAEPIDISCVIKQVGIVDVVTGEYQIGAMFADISEETMNYITRFVLAEESRRIVKQRLIEED